MFDVELDTLFKWTKSIGDMVKRRFDSIFFCDPDVVCELSRVHENLL